MKLSKFVKKADNYVYLRVRDTSDNIILEGNTCKFDMKYLKKNDAKVLDFYLMNIMDHGYPRTIIGVTVKKEKE